MSERKESEKSVEQVTQNNKITQPILYKNKIFPFARLKKSISFHQKQKASTLAPNENIIDKNLQDEIVTTENLIPHLEQEIDKEESTKELIETTLKSVEKQQSNKKKWLSFGFLMLNLAILAGILIYQFSNEEPVSISVLLTSTINWWWLLIAVVVFMLINVVDSMRVSITVKKATGRSRPYLSYKSTLICRFYDSITPLATGGQPFQIYYLAKRGLNASTASSVPLAKYFYSQVTFIIYTLIILFVSFTMDLHINPVLYTLSWVGLVLNVLLIAAVFFLSISKKTAPRIMIWLLKLGAKMHIVKDYRSSFRRVMRTVKEYTTTFKMFMKSGWMALFQFLLSVVYLTLVYSIPFIVYCIFVEFNPSLWFTFLIFQVVCDLELSFIPIPGGAGTAELSFSALFQTYFKDTGVFVWAILFWRFFTYYAYLLQGALVLLYDFLIGNRKIAPLLQRFKDEDRAKAENLKNAVVNAQTTKKGKKDTEKYVNFKSNESVKNKKE